MTVKKGRKRTAQTGNQPGPSSQCDPDGRRRILVVDDDPDICRLNVEALTFSGYHADSAHDGAAAWRALQLTRYDLLITDQNMPKLSGVELLKKLHAARMALPVILMTGTPPTERLKRHPWLQIDATLLKPYAIEGLLAMVRNVLLMNGNGCGETVPLVASPRSLASR